jgi:hypothetical protein
MTIPEKMRQKKHRGKSISKIAANTDTTHDFKKSSTQFEKSERHPV